MSGWSFTWWYSHLLLLSVVSGIETILVEDFEDTDISYTVSHPDNLTHLNSYDYYGRLDVTDLPDQLIYSNFQGNGFYGAQDINASNASIEHITLTWSNIPISHYENLALSWYVAEDASADGNQDWDSTSSFRIEVQIDGSAAETIFAIEAQHNAGALYNHAPLIDNNFDGIGDGAIINHIFSYHERPINNGDLLTVIARIEKLNDGDEDIAFDQLRLTGSLIPELAQYPLMLIYTLGLAYLFQRPRLFR